MTTVALFQHSGGSSDALRRVLTDYATFERAHLNRRRLTANVPVPALLGWTVARLTGLLALHTLVLAAAALATLVVAAWAREAWAKVRLTRLLMSDVTTEAGIVVPEARQRERQSFL